MTSNQILDRYGDWVGHKLGAGAFGTVHMWQNSADKRTIAIKKCKAESRDTRNRWQQEMRMMENLHHPNIVAFIPIPDELIREYPPQTCLGMEYCEKGDLRRFLYKPEFCCGLPEYHVRDIMCDVGSAIKYLHEQKNMHRDLKPENIVLTDRPDCGGRYLFKVTDLGYAKELDQLHSFAQSFVGTFAYLAPEIAVGQNTSYGQLKYHSQVDYWSFGLVVFECITGIRPMTAGEAPHKKDDHVCWLHDDNGNRGFLSYIPKPHHLNPHFESSVVPWLKLMLLLDEAKRGGENNEWYRRLTDKISPTKVKYVKVLDVRSMEPKTFPIEVNARPQSVVIKIEKVLNVSQTDQFLLMEGGGPPIATQRILQQMKALNPKMPEEESILYLFSKSSGDWPSYKYTGCRLITRFHESEDAVFVEQGTKRCFHILLNDTLSIINTGYMFQRALHGLIRKVEKMSKQLEEVCKSFLHAREKTAGMVELFVVSLEKDISSYRDQDNASGICVYEEFTRSGDDSRELVKEWESHFADANSLIKDANEEFKLRMKNFSSLELQASSITNEFMALQTIHSNAVAFYCAFKKDIKAAADRGTQSTEKQKSQIREFKKKQWSKAKDFVERALNPKGHLRTIMRFLIDHHTRLESIYFKIMDKKQCMEFIQENIKNKQRDRQHMIWNMLQYMKDVYGTAAQYERDDLPEQELSQEITNLHQITQALLNDPDFHSVIRVSTEDLQANSRASTQPHSRASSHGDLPETAASVGKPGDCGEATEEVRPEPRVGEEQIDRGNEENTAPA